MGWYTTDVSYRVGDIEPWRADKSYLSGKYVSYKTPIYGGLYVAKLGVVVPLGVPPTDNSPYWDLVVPGMTGATGSIGPQGPTGDTTDGNAAFDQIAALISSLGLPFDPNDSLAFFNALKLLAGLYGGGGSTNTSCGQIKDILENKTTLDLATGQLTVDCDGGGTELPITAPSVLTPTNNTTLCSSVCVVDWSSTDERITGFRITAGSSIGDATYVDSGTLNGVVRTYELTGLPTDASIIYITFMYNTGVTWITQRRQVTANDPTLPVQSYAEYSIATGRLAVDTTSEESFDNGILTLTGGTETFSYTDGYLSVA